jgi:mono/diheme cytochrome c family protein
MHRTGSVRALFVLALVSACGSEKSNEPPAQNSSALTYYEDMLPIFEQHCMECHQQGGIAPFRLDQYAEAKRRALDIADATSQREMPPWSPTSDGSCQQFSHTLALDDDQIQAIAAWVDAGALQGTPRSVNVPERPALGDATEFSTPEFSPTPQGGDLAEFDEYRCFLMDESVDATKFITGYEVIPGTPAVVHHVLAMLVDPAADAELTGKTNGELMAELDGASPDRDGWPCFGMAGDGVMVESVPVVWAPGQGVVEYPGESGVPLEPRHRVVLQVHYNLADDPGSIVDRSTVRLRLASSVANVGVFVLDDPFLGSLYDDVPQTLEPNQPSVTYTWERALGDYFGDLPNVKLYGLMPHMHELGHRYRMTLERGGVSECAMDVKSWDFHWQRMYFYAEPLAIDSRSRIEVTCDFDTSSESAPVLPGWGTRNEMCLATMYFTIPAAQLDL